MTTRAQYEREKLRDARAKQLEILASAERTAAPLYVIGAAGFWLERWGGQRSALLRSKKQQCPISSTMNAPAVESSSLSLSI